MYEYMQGVKVNYAPRHTHTHTHTHTHRHTHTDTHSSLVNSGGEECNGARCVYHPRSYVLEYLHHPLSYVASHIDVRTVYTYM